MSVCKFVCTTNFPVGLCKLITILIIIRKQNRIIEPVNEMAGNLLINSKLIISSVVIVFGADFSLSLSRSFIILQNVQMKADFGAYVHMQIVLYVSVVAFE